VYKCQFYYYYQYHCSQLIMNLPLFIVDTCQVAVYNSMVRTEVEGSQVRCHCPVRPHTVTHIQTHTHAVTMSGTMPLL